MAHIILEQKQMKKVKLLCQRCRYIKKKTIDVEMKPVSFHNTIWKFPLHFMQLTWTLPALSKHICLLSNVYQLRLLYCNLNDMY